MPFTLKFFNKLNIEFLFINYLSPFLLFDFLGLFHPLNSSEFYLTNYSNVNKNSKDFIKNEPILKTYGPLILDINNLNSDSGIIFIPMINIESKPLILSIHCEESIFNIKNRTEWRDWFKPFFTYELNILNDFCDDKNL